GLPLRSHGPRSGEGLLRRLHAERGRVLGAVARARHVVAHGAVPVRGAATGGPAAPGCSAGDGDGLRSPARRGPRPPGLDEPIRRRLEWLTPRGAVPREPQHIRARALPPPPPR